MSRPETKAGDSGRKSGSVLVRCLIAAGIVVLGGTAGAVNAGKSVNSTSQNRSKAPANQVAEQPYRRLVDYQILAANDLGMHCGDLDQRVASILPPFNVLHAQVLKKGAMPQILTGRRWKSCIRLHPIRKTRRCRIPHLRESTRQISGRSIPPRTTLMHTMSSTPTTPPGILGLFELRPDFGLPVPDLQRLYLGDGALAADQQAMPSATGPSSTQPYKANVPQAFALFYQNIPFFIRFPFGYTLGGINWFSAEGIPVTPFDDSGRLNAYPLMRVQARALGGNGLGVSPGTVMASLDTVTPVSGEVDCKNCHTSATDGGNGLATDNKGFTVATRFQDPQFG